MQIYKYHRNNAQYTSKSDYKWRLMNRIFFAVFLVVAGCSIRLQAMQKQSRVQSEYAWLRSAVTDTCLATALTAAGSALAPRAYSAISPFFQASSLSTSPLASSLFGSINLHSATLHQFAQIGKAALPFIIGAAVCYRAYKAQTSTIAPEANTIKRKHEAQKSQSNKPEILQTKIAVTWLQQKYKISPKDSNSRPSTLKTLGQPAGLELLFPQKNGTAPQDSEFSQTDTTQMISGTSQKNQTIPETIEPIIDTNIPLGLINPHNNCFMNAVLQVLSNIPEISDYFKAPETSDLYSQDSLSIKYKNLLEGIENSRTTRTTAFSPVEFCEQARTIMRFEPTSQEDAQDFFDRFLDKLSNTDLTLGHGIVSYGYPYMKSIQTIPNKLFTIFLHSRLEIGGIAQAKASPERLLSLEIPTTNQNTQEILSLKHCLENFFAPEKVEDCIIPGTKTRDTARKTLRLLNTPTYVEIQLKRFAYSINGPSKINTPISIPLNLDLSDYYNDEEKPVNAQYALSAIIVHRGATSQDGHYYAYIRKGTTWYCCNDNYIAEFKDIQDFTDRGYYNKSDLPYLVFYQRESENHKSKHLQIQSVEELCEELQKHGISKDLVKAYANSLNIECQVFLDGINDQLTTIGDLTEEITNWARKPSITNICIPNICIPNICIPLNTTIVAAAHPKFA